MTKELFFSIFLSKNGRVKILSFYTTGIYIHYNLREAQGNKTLVLLQRARSTPSPQGEVCEPFRPSR